MTARITRTPVVEVREERVLVKFGAFEDCPTITEAQELSLRWAIERLQRALAELQ